MPMVKPLLTQGMQIPTSTLRSANGFTKIFVASIRHSMAPAKKFIGPLHEDQTFTPMVLSWPEGQPNMMDRLERVEVMGTENLEAVVGIEKTLTVGTSFKDKDG